MKIISISDVITNSSSEVFILTSPYKAKDLKDILLEIHKDGYEENVDRCSGMGGIFDISDWTIFYISQAADLWFIRKGMLGDWEKRINDSEDRLTWEDVSKYYEKYPDLDKKEFSYTIKDWLEEYNISDVENLLYLDSDQAQDATRAYIYDNCTILGGDTFEEDKIPYPYYAYSILNKSIWNTSILDAEPELAKYVINQIKTSGLKTFMNYENIKCV